ncbi:MAG: methyltransferase regulatory domain-containing protein [Blastocatellia bacterium]
MNENFTYNDVPYPSFVFPQTHPDSLGAMATVFGMNPARPEKCRVLELGCGDGTNLISFAYVLPNSEFVGIDLSQVHIDQANQTAGRLGISNTNFRKEDILELDTNEVGKFDFIIAHGLYSWVPENVRRRVLEIYGLCLTENGVGYISYNAYPGCHMREIACEIMRYHTETIGDPYERVRQGLAFIDFLGNAAEKESVYEALLKHEFAEITQRKIANIYHDDFAEINQPFYFHEFNDYIARHGLQYVCESDAVAMQDGGFAPDVRKVLAEFGGDYVRREQYLDFINGRRFRSSLICRKSSALDRKPSPTVLSKLLLSSGVAAESENLDITGQSVESFAHPKGGSFQVNHPLTKTALAAMVEHRSRCVPYSSLLKEAMQRLKAASVNVTSDDENKTASFLFEMFRAGMLKIHLWQPEFSFDPGELPHASEFARWQAERGSQSVTTLTGMNLKLENELVRHVILAADGKSDRGAMEKAIHERVSVPENQKANFARELPELIEFSLNDMALSGLILP